jgi:Skp family chaperone for outer membrane proteins
MQLLSQEPFSMHRPVFSPAGLVLLITLGAGTAFAQQEQSAAPAKGPCAADVARLCPNAQGRADVHACLKQNADQVSAECKARIEQIQQKFEAAREACQPDVAKFCADVKPGGRRIAACLREHSSELSQACQAAIPAKKGG